jgi:hypothetical protein
MSTAASGSRLLAKMQLERKRIRQGDKELTVMVGRKRKQGKRERNGRIQRERAIDPKVISLGQPHRQSVPAEKRHDQRAENPFGRLNLINAVSDVEYDAGIKYRDDYLRYRVTIDSPNPNPAAISLDRIAYGGRLPLSEEEAARRRNTYMRAFEAVTGYGPRLVIKSVVFYEKELQPGDLPDLRIALQGLVKHYGLQNDGKKRVVR